MDTLKTAMASTQRKLGDPDDRARQAARTMFDELTSEDGCVHIGAGERELAVTLDGWAAMFDRALAGARDA